MLREELDELLDLLEEEAERAEGVHLCVYCKSGGREHGWAPHKPDCRLLSALRKWGRRGPDPARQAVDPSEEENGAQGGAEGSVVPNDSCPECQAPAGWHHKDCRKGTERRPERLRALGSGRRKGLSSDMITDWLRGKVGLEGPVRGKE